MMKYIRVLVFVLCSIVGVYGESVRGINTDIWHATTRSDAMQKLYGTTKTYEDSRIVLKAPKVSSTGNRIPISIATSIPAKSIALFQDSNPYALVAFYKIYPKSITEYSMKIRMHSSGTLTVVVEGMDGKLYSKEQRIQVALGGCEGSGSYTSHRTPAVSHIRHNTEAYNFINENSFKEVTTSPLSTFSVDVDTASYSNVRRYLFSQRALPQKGVVRSEEMINYFDYGYQEPKGDTPFAIHSRVGESIWNKDSQVIHIGLQTKKADLSTLPASNLVFLLDVSGSMHDENKLPLLVKSLKLLVKQLRQKDQLSLVVYAGSSGVVLERARGDEKYRIIEALERLRAGGSTAGAKGIKLAYEVAQKFFIEGGNNRIILATDGDFNVGVSSQSALVELIEEKRKSGIYLTVLGFGMGNYKDSKIELLANKGNGNYAYIDTLLEAKKVLVTQMGGTLYTVAKDVKIQVEFNPKKVHSYRLIGYENRLLNNEDFKNDKVDAGEVGMGHSVTALYEIVPYHGQPLSVDTLKYQTITPLNSSEVATVKISYKDIKSGRTVYMRDIIEAEKESISKHDYLFAQTVAGFAMLLRQSKYIKTLSYTNIIALAKEAKGEDAEGYRAGFIRMVEQAALLGTLLPQNKSLPSLLIKNTR